MRGDLRERHRPRPERQGRRHHHKAHGFVQDHRFQRTEAKQTDQQRQAKFRAAEADQPPESADDGAAAKGNGLASLRGRNRAGCIPCAIIARLQRWEEARGRNTSEARLQPPLSRPWPRPSTRLSANRSRLAPAPAPPSPPPAPPPRRVKRRSLGAGRGARNRARPRGRQRLFRRPSRPRQPVTEVGRPLGSRALLTI